MKTMTVGEFKGHFSEVVELVKSGVGVEVTYGRQRKIVGYFLPKFQQVKSQRPLGILADNATVEFKTDYLITEKELLG